jgi:hypothetical protein
MVLLHRRHHVREQPPANRPCGVGNGWDFILGSNTAEKKNSQNDPPPDPPLVRGGAWRSVTLGDGKSPPRHKFPSRNQPPGHMAFRRPTVRSRSAPQENRRCRLYPPPGQGRDALVQAHGSSNQRPICMTTLDWSAFSSVNGEGTRAARAIQPGNSTPQRNHRFLALRTTPPCLTN